MSLHLPKRTLSQPILQNGKLSLAVVVITGQLNLKMGASERIPKMEIILACESPLFPFPTGSMYGFTYISKVNNGHIQG